MGEPLKRNVGPQLNSMTSVVKTDAEIARRFVPNAASIHTLLIASFFLGIAGVSGNAQPPPPSSKTSLTNSPSPHYHVVHGWPVHTILDEVSAVAVDSHDEVLVLQRGGRKWPDSGPFDTSPIPVPTLFVFDGRTGRLLKKWGEKILALPHSITVDSKDNVWIADGKAISRRFLRKGGSPHWTLFATFCS